ncbi:alpha/beta hydrolase [uncultured Nocardioides sp.]|uniref:alpha/beta hydrolase n=1 Tax=uncultured Nocardioides sp. TaxID=198441 RepID=UPI000C65C6F2|nr:alpha/beta hydrolase [uncultured Nocardioides sp.]MAO80733.1 hypothetical protein [Nocardioides sp.]
MSGPSGEIVGVTGGQAGVAASWAALLALADRYDEAAERMRGWAGEGADVLLDPDLLASGLLSPVTFAEAEAGVLAATVGPDGVGTESLGWEVDARSLRLVVAALSAADSGVAEAVAGLEHLVGRTVGWTIGATAPALLPVGLLAAGRTVLLAPDLPQRAAPALERWLTAHPEEVEHLVAGGGGLLEGLWDGLTPTVPGGPWGLPLDTGDAAAAAALLSRLYPDGRVRATPLPGVRVEASSRAPGDVADLVEHVAQLSELSGPEHPEMNGTIELQTLTGGDGSVRHVLYLPGTDDMTTLPWTRDGDVRDMGTNLSLMGGLDDGYAHGVLAALERSGVGDDPVLVVGHSQGGMLAADLLASAPEHGVAISHAVTLGSPTGQLAGFPEGSHLLSLEHRGDVVPLLDGVANPDTVEQVTVTFDTDGATGGRSAGVADHHGFPAYAQGAALVDTSADPSVRAAVQELERAGFLRAPEGTSVTSRVLQLVREAQP